MTFACSLPGDPLLIPFELEPLPRIVSGIRRRHGLAEDLRGLPSPAAANVLVVTDPRLLPLGLVDPLLEVIERSGARVQQVFDRIEGEPKATDVDAAAEAVRHLGATGVVICLGGGSVLDIGKAAAVVAAAEPDVLHYALGARPLPERTVRLVCLPTTAGTGSEFSSGNIFSGPDGAKLWLAGPSTKPDLVLLDPELTVSLPPALTAWTGLDALVHALEACTNQKRTPVSDLFAHEALRLAAAALPAAVADGKDLGARGRMQLASAYAGIAIDLAGTAIAHALAHGLAAFGPIGHGQATALGLEATLAWSVEADDGRFSRAAAALGLEDAPALPGWFSSFVDRLGVERRLPPAFRSLDPAALISAIEAPPNSPMRDATLRKIEGPDLERFAATLLSFAP